jgi:hypothetical protein
MKYWCYNEPWYDDDLNIVYDVMVKSEDEIIAEYYDSWCEKMIAAGKGDCLSVYDCIDDWVSIHWAWESTN